jgi:predicted ATP-dependent protease
LAGKNTKEEDFSRPADDMATDMDMDVQTAKPPAMTLADSCTQTDHEEVTAKQRAQAVDDLLQKTQESLTSLAARVQQLERERKELAPEVEHQKFRPEYTMKAASQDGADCYGGSRLDSALPEYPDHTSCSSISLAAPLSRLPAQPVREHHTPCSSNPPDNTLTRSPAQYVHGSLEELRATHREERRRMMLQRRAERERLMRERQMND